ncbi:MAG TPA: methicillin resistance protein, partial [Clostridiales bacterium]|nr:methicillin resistance protein [Clostridiales bacterium]
IKDGTKEDLKDFHKIMITTGIRDGFITRPLEYFEKMYDELGPEHMKILMAYYDNEPISGVIPIMYGNKTWYLYGASSNEHRNLMPNYLLQWEMIKIALNRKSDIYDLRGVPGIADNSNGLYRMKKGFGAEYTEFVGEVYMPYKPLMYNLYKFSEKAFRNIRALKLKFKK